MPVMVVETEQVFSVQGVQILWDITGLWAAGVEQTEYLKSWIRLGLPRHNLYSLRGRPNGGGIHGNSNLVAMMLYIAESMKSFDFEVLFQYIC